MSSYKDPDTQEEPGSGKDPEPWRDQGQGTALYARLTKAVEKILSSDRIYLWYQVSFGYDADNTQEAKCEVKDPWELLHCRTTETEAMPVLLWAYQNSGRWQTVKG